MELNKKNLFKYPQPIKKHFNFNLLPTHLSENSIQFQITKIILSTHIKPISNTKFTLVFSPFHPSFQPLQTNKLIKCKNCQTYLNPKSLIKSSLQYICNICNRVGYYESSFSNSYLQNQIISVISKKEKIRRILIVIQASQHIYESKIYQTIMNVLQILKQQQQIEIGFVLYDDKNIYILSIEDLSLYVIVKDLQIPILLENIFKRINEINLQKILNILSEILYQSYLIKNTQLNTVRMFLSQVILQQPLIQCKFIVTIIPEQPQIQVLQKTQNDNFDFFILASPPKFQKIMQFLQTQVYRIYNHKALYRQDFYYDFYHNIQRGAKRRLKNIIVKTTQYVNYNPSNKLNQLLNPSSVLMLDFQINKNIQNNPQNLTKQFIQIQLEQKNQTLIINYSIKQILKQLSFESSLSYINDEIYFYVTIRRIVQNNLPQKRKNQLFNHLQTFSFLKLQKQSGFHIPKSLINTFLFCYMVESQPFMQPKKSKFTYADNIFQNEGLETIFKTIYPNVYQVSDILKQVASIHNKFELDKIMLVDNGMYLYIVYGEEVSVQKLKESFGEWDYRQIKNIKQLPQLNTNQNLRKNIEVIRANNELYYLPIKIISLDSIQFQMEIGKYLYVSDNHRRYLLNIFGNKKMR